MDKYVFPRLNPAWGSTF